LQDRDVWQTHAAKPICGDRCARFIIIDENNLPLTHGHEFVRALARESPRQNGGAVKVRGVVSTALTRIEGIDVGFPPIALGKPAGALARVNETTPDRAR